jgi:hypothetical protein
MTQPTSNSKRTILYSTGIINCAAHFPGNVAVGDSVSFGLLHGLGFGGALREVRLPHILRIELVHKVDDHLILMRLMIRE